MQAVALDLPEVKLLNPTVYRDDRGAFLETWNERSYHAHGVDLPFVQDNMSISARGVLRGLHYQVIQPQGKLVRVVRGAIHDVVVDLRRSSPRFGRHVAVRLDAEEQAALWVPPGFAHGFLALSDDTRVQYKVTDYWAPAHERTLAWDDPAVAVAWPLEPGELPKLSAKDRVGTRLADADTYP